MPDAFDEPTSAPVLIETAFHDHALTLVDAGLCPVPCGGDDGKAPLVKWARFRARPCRAAVERWAARPTFAAAGIGILTGQLSGVTIIDIDEPALLEQVLQVAGDTPIIVETPSGGRHAWYRSSGEASRNLRNLGLKIDIRGNCGFAVVPPTLRPSGPYAGRRYQFIRGSFTDLPKLPAIRSGWLEQLVGPRADQIAEHAACGDGIVTAGLRNATLFSTALRQARQVASEDALIAAMQAWNCQHCSPPLPPAEVEKTVRSAWRYEAEGRNWIGRGGVSISAATRRDLRCPDALHLLHILRCAHAARDGGFAVSPRAMAKADAAEGLGEWRISQALKRLVETGYLVRIYTGGRSGTGDASLYQFGRDPAHA